MQGAGGTEGESWIRRGFVFAGLVNVLGTLSVSRFFTNAELGRAYPELLSTEGAVLIMLWGAAYIAVAGRYRQVPWLLLVFVAEKVFYTWTWVQWLVAHGSRLRELLAADFVTGFFYAGYGLIDLAFGLFFLYAFARARSPLVGAA
jgi:hypothetical protein